MTRRVVCVFASLIAFGVSSAAPPPKDTPKKEPYYATKVGTKWVYDYGGSEMTVVASHVEKKDDGTVVTCDYVSADGKQTPAHKCLVSSAGVWMTEEVGEEYTPAWQLFKSDAKVGEVWKVATARIALRISSTYTVAEEEEITVPAGKFKAAKLNITDFNVGGGPGGTAYSIWYARSVGEVKRVTDDGKLIRELKAFTPGKD
jgi:hypothetical protein